MVMVMVHGGSALRVERGCAWHAAGRWQVWWGSGGEGTVHCHQSPCLSVSPLSLLKMQKVELDTDHRLLSSSLLLKSEHTYYFHCLLLSPPSHSPT